MKHRGKKLFKKNLGKFGSKLAILGKIGRISSGPQNWQKFGFKWIFLLLASQAVMRAYKKSAVIEKSIWDTFLQELL